MVAQRGTDEVLADELGSALVALQDVLQVDNLATLFLELGLDDPPDVGDDPQFVQTLITATDECSAVETALDDLAEAVDGDDPGARLQAVANVIEAVAALAGALDAVATDLKRATQGSDDAAAIAAFAEEMVGRLIEAVVVYHLEVVHPVVARILAVLTVVEVTPLPLPPEPPLQEGTGDAVEIAEDTPQTIPPTRRRLHLDRLGQLLQDPLAVMQTAYGWGDDNFDGKKLFLAIGQLSDALGSLSVIDEDEDGDATAALSLSAVLFVPSPDVQPPGIDGLLHVDLAPATEIVIARPSESWRLSLQLASALGAGLELRLLPPAQLSLRPPEGTVDGAARLGFIGESPDAQTPFIIVGQSSGSRLQARRVEVGFLADLTFDGTAGQATADVGFEATLVEGVVVIDVSESDGFLQSILPANGITTPVNLAITWSQRDGIRIRGGVGLRTSIDVHAKAGPLRLDTLHLALEPAADALVLAATVTGAATLGPFVVTVDGVGAAAELRFERGNLGPVDISGGFRPPTAIGVSVEVPAITGGGFVGLDPATGRYTGVLELKLAEVSVDAVVLIETRLPGAAPGFSLLVAMRASFPPVNVGFGFALTAVGGLLALNRRVDVDVLRQRIASGTAGRILNPADPVRHAPALLADLGTVFPVAPGVHVVGPTVQLVWAGLVHFDIGVFIELPGPTRIVILGSAHAEIARGRTQYLCIRIDVVGVVDLQARTAAFDAVLIDSQLLEVLDLTGGAAFRLSWGAQPYAVLTVGGFHPAYNPEPLVFPESLTRIAMTRGKPSDQLYLRFEGYLAVTTNTFQFGAAVEAIINVGDFNIQGTLGFDTLIRFQPFHFQVDIRASVRVRYKSRGLGGLTFTGSLSGPGPVILRGRVCIELLFFDICFDETFTLGSSEPPAVTTVASAVAALLEELERPGNLRASETTDRYVVVRPPPPDLDMPVVSPLGQLAWVQRRAPLGLLLQRIDGAPLDAPEAVTVSGPQLTGPELDWFAPGSFADLTDAEALNRKAFERLSGGVRFGERDTDDGPEAQQTVTLRQIRLPDAVESAPSAVSFPTWFVESVRARTGGAVAAPVSPALVVDEESWTVSDPLGGPVANGLSAAQAHQLAALRGGTAAARADLVAGFTF
jgi:hypothetical protein